MPNGRHYAILIGSSSFHPKSGLKALRCPEHDVDGMAALLTSAEYGLFASEHILTFKNQPHHEILPEINEVFHQAQAEDLILLYYSGHGELDNKDHLHLATPDTRKAALETTSIPTERLRRLIDNYRCKRVVLILDCCYSGAIKNDLLKSSLDGQMNQLAKGIYILTASTELQTAEEKEGDEHSLLTKHILHGIKQGKVPSDANGNISISALQQYVSVTVPRDGAQQPSGYGLDERGGELIIARAAQAYDLRAFRLLINRLEAEEEIDDELADDVRNFIKHSQPKRDKALLELLNQLLTQTIKPGRFISQWQRLNQSLVVKEKAMKSKFSTPPVASPENITKQQQPQLSKAPVVEEKALQPKPNTQTATSEAINQAHLRWKQFFEALQVEEKPAQTKSSAPPASSPETKAKPIKTAPLVSTQPPAQRSEITIAKPDTVVAGTGFTDDLKGVKLEMIYVPGGKFTMGSSDGRDNENPPHPVTVPNFYIGKFQITQAQWEVVMGNNPSKFKGDDLPVERVSWNDAQQFCRKLSQMTDKAYRLPTEAEWEYACRAGTMGDYAGYLEGLGWYGKNSGGETHPVGEKQTNAFGLYDMHGNVWEWCEDVWHDNYKDAPDDGSAWVQGGNQDRRILRGGSWYDSALDCRSSYRSYYHFTNGFGSIGYRVVVSARTQ